MGKRESEHQQKYHLVERPTPAAKRAIISALTELDSGDRELLRLFFDEGLADSEVAAALGISADNARQRKGRLVKRLHKEVSEAMKD